MKPSHCLSPIVLYAGPVAVRFDAGDLRGLRVGEREVIRRIYGAVRDHDWGTVPGEISELKCEAGADCFRIGYVRTHRAGDLHFVWRAEIAGEADGTIRFGFDGEALTSFLRNRIGICVLHPIRECAGARCRTRHVDGSEREGRFPVDVAAEQPMGGFNDLAGLAHEVASGLWAELDFAGEVFETEDQRNWIDASFKTYGTPLRLPFPSEIRAGMRIRQSVTLRLRTLVNGGIDALPGSTTAAGDVVVRAEPAMGVSRLPQVGLGMASHGWPLVEQEIAWLSRLNPSHLRVDLRLAEPAWARQLRTAARDALELGSALELAIHLPRGSGGDLSLVAKELGRLKADLTRALVFREGEKSTRPEDLAAARAAFAESGMELGAGTDADLYQLNQQRPLEGADFVCWSMNPQVHAGDETSIAETPEAVRHQVASMHRRHPRKSLVISPVTLRPRFNPVATGSPREVPPGELPPEVDERQCSRFAAAWTLGMLAALSEAGVESVTLFETTGWRGVMETLGGSSLPEGFPSRPGGVFPLFHVLADIGEFCGARVVPTVPGESSGVASLLLESGGRARLLLANLGRDPRRVSLTSFPQATTVRRLDALTEAEAVGSPGTFRARHEPWNGPWLELGAFDCVTLDFGAWSAGLA